MLVLKMEGRIRSIPETTTRVGRKNLLKKSVQYINLVTSAENTPSIPFALIATLMLKTVCNSKDERCVNMQGKMRRQSVIVGLRAKSENKI